MTTTIEPTEIAAQSAESKKAKEAYFTASQSQLIWARFKKQRAAMVAATVLFALIVGGIFAPFLSPYDPTIAGRDKDYTNGAPQFPQFCDSNGCSLRPFSSLGRARAVIGHEFPLGDHGN